MRLYALHKEENLQVIVLKTGQLQLTYLLQLNVSPFHFCQEN